MCNSCSNITVNVDRAYDPTQTTTLRNFMVRESNRRFTNASLLIKQSIINEDVFGLTINVNNTPGQNAFAYLSDDQKVAAFLRWLEDMLNQQIIDAEGIPQGVNTRNWLNKYLQDAYQRGVARARQELRKAGYDVPTVLASGGMPTIMQAPIHIDTLAMLYTRTFNDLKGITDAMRQQIARLLTEGFMSGKNPRRIAREMLAAINGTGMGDLGLVDTLGRFIPARRRAEILARTEIIRAHHHANINEYMTWGAYGVSVQAEFKTAGDNRVCPECASLDGQIFTLEEVLPMIPVHPQCRCIALPIVKTKES
jgi:SPP1 gp7 family putative phage head morphogenesis protein